MVSKALVAATYRHKLDLLADLGAELTAVVPAAWREGGSSQNFEPGDSGHYRLIVTPLRWNGHFHLHYYPDLPRIIRECRPELVHLDEEAYNLATYLGLRSALSQGIRTIFFSWQNLLRRYPPPFRQIEGYVYRHVSGAIAGTREVEDVLRHKGYAGKLAVIPQFGVDTELFSPGHAVDDKRFRVGFLNRLTEGKSPLLALEAFARLPPDSFLEVVGDGPLRQQMEESVRRLGLEARVSVRTRVPSGEMPELIRSLDVILLPSITTPRWKEQFGRVLIETMSSGVPVIGSDSGEIPNVIGDAGVIAREGDVAALSEALLDLHTHPDKRTELGERGRRRAVELFSNERIAGETMAFYRCVLGTG